MSRPPYTPGPWEWRKEKTASGIPELYVYTPAGDVAEVYTNAHNEGKPDARLIAQAPRMARVLADFVYERGDCMGDAESEGPGCGYYPHGSSEPCPWCEGMAVLDAAGLLDPQTGEPI